MKPQLTGEIKKDSSVTEASGAEATLSLHEGLVAAIHGAFEVAVHIAVKEVKKLVGEITGDKYEEMRRENELLKQRLQRAEAMLDMKGRGGSLPPTEQLLNDTSASDQPHQPEYSHISLSVTVGEVQACKGISHIHAHQPDETQDTSVNGSEGQRSQLVTDAAADPDEQQNNGFTAEISHTYAVKVENVNQPSCQHSTAQDHHLAPLPSADNRTVLEQVIVKQEQPKEEEEEEEEEEERDGCCLDSIKVEDFGLECMSAVQSQMLEDWEPGVLDTESQDPDSQMSSRRLAQAHPPNMITGLEPPTDLPSLPSELPIFQLAEPAPIPEAPPQVYGVHMRTSRQLANTVASLYACKSCGQTFHLPSLLRRHYSQCPQKLQQRCLQPVAGGKRTRLQLYPPGCSPFRCTECNREFNRMENLKTHLRIHTGERPYTCSVCSKCFRHSGALTRHFRIHTGEKPYVCGQCGKSFRNCGGLKFHQRSHSKQIQ